MQMEYQNRLGQPPVLYHYCHQGTLCKILRSRVLHATDALNAKDKDELVYARNVVGPITDEQVRGRQKYYIKLDPDVARVRELFGEFETYIACLSANETIPSQWECYGEEGYGWAIGFDLKAIANLSRVGTFLGPFPLVYDRGTQDQHIRRFLTKATSIRNRIPKRERVELGGIANRELFALWIALKDPQFKKEEEWRLLVIQNDQVKSYQTEHDEGRRYIKLSVCTQETIVEVVIGPRNELTEEFVRQALVEAGLPCVRVRRSEVAL